MILKTWWMLFIFVVVNTEILLFSEENGTCEEATEGGTYILTLKGAIARALQCNRQILGTYESVEKAKLGLEFNSTEFDWDIRPNSQAGFTGGGGGGTGITLGGGLDFSRRYPNGTRICLSPSILKFPKQYHTNLRATISQPLLRGRNIEYNLASILGAEYGYRSALRSLYFSQVSLILRTVTSMYEVVKQEETVKFSQESFERMKKFLQAVKMKEKIGLADALDIYRAEAEFKQAEDVLNNTLERYQDSLDVVRDILALPLDTCIQINVPVQYRDVEITLEEAIEKALQNRLEIEQSEDQIQESYRLSRIAQQNLKPDLNLVLTYNNLGKGSVFTRSCACKRENTWGIGFTTSSDFGMDAEKLAYEQSILGVEGAERNLEQTKENIVLEIKRVLRQLKRADKRITLHEEQVKNSRGELYLSEIKFDRGMANNFDVVQAEKSLRNAETSLINAIIDHIVGEFQLYSALGMLLEKPCVY